MITSFIVCFIAGLGLSVVSFLSGLHHVPLFGHVLHGHHLPHLPRLLRHASPRPGKATAMINAAASTAFLTWFGGGGLILDRLTPWSMPALYAGAATIGMAGGALINRAINALARQESLAESLSMIGVIARVVVPIRAGDGTGEIVFTHSGTRRVSGARSDSGRAVEKGTEVVVTRYEKGLAYVATWSDLKEE
jgi:membrane protein implicated in regulation of membrane protease activity